ncbi:hypothetical protein FRZ06_00155 [Anoxybacterium hadale]|uniref:Uncharacterized protein n=1 Tax=Anoxybacterium hadale TaxID=3408580 RepID=A0ACD1A675_9FIRM|nr:hypothetical protein FRZ06_00155 [Clostridiales bacterium]
MMDSETKRILEYQILAKEDFKFTPNKDYAELFANYLEIEDALTQKKKLDSNQHYITTRPMGYYFVQVNDKNQYGIQIAPSMD